MLRTVEEMRVRAEQLDGRTKADIHRWADDLEAAQRRVAQLEHHLDVNTGNVDEAALLVIDRQAEEIKRLRERVADAAGFYVPAFPSDHGSPDFDSRFQN
jgi:hypothetical protein